jgi:hypothetical protein
LHGHVPAILQLHREFLLRTSQGGLLVAERLEGRVKEDPRYVGEAREQPAAARHAFDT